MSGVLQLGNLALALPLGAALAAGLLAAGAWRTSLCWAGCFGAAVLLVGASKIAHLGWGTDFTPFAFQAISGHATMVAALYPFAAWVLLDRHDCGAARLALAGALLLAAAFAGLLVTSGEHSTAEASSGWLLGAAVSLAGVAGARDLRRAQLAPAACWSLAVFMLAAWLMQSAHIGYWMIRLALALSGNRRPYAWDERDACS